MRSLPLTSRISSQPSPSTSRKAQPDPIVSGSQRLPVRPALCVNLSPAVAVISVNRTASVPAGQRSQDPLRNAALRIVIVNRLPLIIVLGPGQSRHLGERLRGLVGFKSAEKRLFAFGFRG